MKHGLVKTVKKCIFFLDEGTWHDIDKAESHDPLFSSQYAPEIYQYMKTREVGVVVGVTRL